MASMVYPLRGASMWPLGVGWSAEVEPGSDVKRGDLVAYLSARGTVVVHRVHNADGDPLEVRGDSAGSEPGLPRAAIIGRVVALRRGALRLPLPADGSAALLQRRLGLWLAQAIPICQRLRRRLRAITQKV